MLGWIIFVVVLLLWIVTAIWRAVIFVGHDMVESWQNGEEYTNELFGEAVRTGFLQGLVWPFVTPFQALGTVLYRWSFKLADRKFTVAGEEVPEPAPPRHDITDELAKVEPEPIPESRIQARLRAEAEAAREEYKAKRLNDETAIGTIEPYPAKHADE